MRYPVNYVAITNDFKKGSHNGLDLGWNSKNGGKNQPILASEDGKVIYKQTQTSGGKVIHIKHNNGYVTEYAHLDTWVVNKGDKVKMGQKIGTMGCSGKATGNHLHYGVYKGTKINYNKPNWVDPKDYVYLTQDQKLSANTSKKYKLKSFPTKKVISSDGLNVRKSSSSLSKKVGFLPYGSEVEVIKTSGSWSKISYNKDEWVSSKYIK